MQAGGRYHVYHPLAQITVQLPGEAKRACDATDGSRDEVVEVSVGESEELEYAEADMVPCLVIKRETLVGVISTSCCTESEALWGSTTVPDILGGGMTV